MSDVNFQFGRNWSATPGSQVDFAFTVEGQDCTNYWGTSPGNVVPITFNSVRTSPQGNQVAIAFECGGGDSQYSDFTGFINATEGAYVDTDFQVTWLLDGYEGAYSVADLEVDKGSTPLDPFEEGGYVDFDFVFDFRLDFADGETIESALTIYRQFAPSIYEGAASSFDLTLNLPAELSVSVYDGASTDVALRTDAALANVQFYEGASASFDFVLPVISLLVPSAYSGENLAAALSTALQLGTVPAYDGANATAALDTLENWHIYDGARADAELSTETTIIPSAYSGETASAVLSVFPSEGLGTFRFYEGLAASTTLAALIQVLLYPNEIKDAGAFNWDVLGHMGIDLNDGTCCPVNDSHEKIELTAGPAPDEYYH